MDLDQATLSKIIDEADRLRDKGQWLEAAALYGRVLEKRLSSGHAWTQYAHVLKEGELFQEAVSAYLSAVRCDGTDPDPRLHLAHLLKRLGQSADALQAFRTLSALPDAPHVGQEIAGLGIQLMQTEQKAPDLFASNESRPGLDVCLSGFKRVQRLEEERAANIAQKNSQYETQDKKRKVPLVAAFIELRRLMKPRFIRARLDPKANLVIRDDLYVAITGNPQFAVRVDGYSLQPGWFEVEIELLGHSSMSFDPILYIEHRLEWATFSTFRLRPMGEGKFYATGLVQGPVLRLRLDPAGREGSFTVRAFKLRQISLLVGLCQAYRQNRDTAQKALRALATPKGRQCFARNIADMLKYAGPDRYHAWIALHDTQTSEETARQRRAIVRWPTQPLFSLIIETGDLLRSELEATLRSLKDQSYGNWQLHIPVASTLPKEQCRFLMSCAETDPRMVVHWKDAQPTMKSVLSKCDGRFIVFVRAGDVLAPSALYEIAERSITKPEARLIFSDEDSIEAGARHSPLFKPDWDPDYFFASNYLGRFVVFEAALIETCCLPLLPLPEMDVHDVILRATEILLPSEITHISHVLYHRNSPAHLSGQNILPYPMTSRRLQALGASLIRQGKEVTVVEEKGGLARVIWPLPIPAPLVTLIIPTRDHLPLLRGCIESLLSKTAYPAFEIIVVDNGSVEPETLRYFDVLRGMDNIHVLSAPGPFNFSWLNNLAVAQAQGSVVGLVNNDILAINSEWLQEMVSHAIRPGIGAVGAKLLYRTGQVQHAGVVCGIGLVAAHPHKYRSGDDPGYMGRLSVTQSFSAVTAACLVVEKSKYNEVGGLDAENLTVAFNDVDFCLKLDKAGYRNLYTPYASLVHLESVTRGLDTTPEKTRRYRLEADFMLRKWGGRIRKDPFYNVNLTADREDFSIGD